MELIVINENKLKIMLTSEDMQKYGMENPNTPSCRELLKIILCDAGLETEFEGNKFFIQMYPSKHGGCEMFVTRLNSDTKEISTMPQNNEQGILPIKASRKPILKKSVYTYIFREIDWLISACKELHIREFSGESAVYRDKEGRYYLILSLALSDSEKSDIYLSFLSEFGEIDSTENAVLYINENGKCICDKNAVTIFAGL